MNILPDADDAAAAVDLAHLAVSHYYGPTGERIQVRDTTNNLVLVASFTLEAALAVSNCLRRGNASMIEFSGRLDQEVIGAVQAIFARSRSHQ